MTLELAQRVVALEIDVDAEGLLQPGLDMDVEAGVGVDAVRFEQEIVGEERLLAFLLLGFAWGLTSGFAIPIAQAFGARDDAAVPTRMVGFKD